VRKSGFRSLSEVRAVVLENDGQWSVIASFPPTWKNMLPPEPYALSANRE
jgi:uncharacterized membrane protein YcaP (DUF421 family)